MFHIGTLFREKSRLFRLFAIVIHEFLVRMFHTETLLRLDISTEWYIIIYMKKITAGIYEYRECEIEKRTRHNGYEWGIGKWSIKSNGEEWYRIYDTLKDATAAIDDQKGELITA